jgi:hypothetical protein
MVFAVSMKKLIFISVLACLPAFARHGVPACDWRLQVMAEYQPRGDVSAHYPVVRQVVQDINRLLAPTHLLLPGPLRVFLFPADGPFQFDHHTKDVRVGCQFPGTPRHPKHLESLYAHEYGHAIFDVAVQYAMQCEPGDRQVVASLFIRDQYEELVAYLFQAVWANDGSITARPDGTNDYTKAPPDNYLGADVYRTMLWKTGHFVWQELLAPRLPEERGAVLARVIDAASAEINQRWRTPTLRFLDQGTINDRLILAITKHMESQ